MGKQPRFFGKPPDLLLGQSRLPQRRPDLQLPQRPHPGPVRGIVRGVGTVQKHRETVGGGSFPDGGEDLLLAVIAAIRRVGRYPFILQYIQRNDFHIRVQRQRHTLGVFKFKGGLKGRPDIIGPNSGTVGHRRVQQISRVHAAGKCQCAAGVFLKKLS